MKTQLKAVLAAGALALLVISLSALWVYSRGIKGRTPTLDQLVRRVQWQGPWYYQVAMLTHTAHYLPERKLDKLAYEIDSKRWQAGMALSKQGTNAWPVIPKLVSAVIRCHRSAGLVAAEALVGMKAEECPGWRRFREPLLGQTSAVTIFHHLVVGRNRFGTAYDSAHRRFGLVGLAATGPAAGKVYADIVDVLQHDKEPELRACAAMVLGGLEAEKKPAVGLLKGILQDKEEWPLVSAAAARALAMAAASEADTADVLRQALQDPRSAVRLAAARALWEMHAPAAEVLPVLTALLNHKLASTRAGALNGLAEMGRAARPSASEVQRLTLDENESVRRAAAEAMKSIAGRAEVQAAAEATRAAVRPAEGENRAEHTLAAQGVASLSASLLLTLARPGESPERGQPIVCWSF